MNINIRFFASLISVFLLFSCCKHEYTAILDTVHTKLINKEYEDAYKRLSPIRFDDVVGAENRARFALLLSIALDKNHIDIKSDSLVRFAVDYYKDTENDFYKAAAYYYLGRVYNHNNDLESCIENYTLAKEHTSDKDHYQKGLIYSSLGNKYKEQHSFNMAIENYNVAVESFKQSGETKGEIINMLKSGDCYSAKKQYSDALSIYNKTMDIAMADSDTVSILDIKKRVAFSKFLLKRPLSEIKEKLTTLYKRYNEGVISADHYSLWTQIYTRENNLDSARYFILKKLNNQILAGSARKVAGAYEALKIIEEATHNYDQALKYGNIVYRMMDSINRADKKILIQDLEQKYETELLKESYTALTKRNTIHQFTWLLSIFILIYLIIYILYKRQFISDSEALLNLQQRYQFLLSESRSSDAQEIEAINRLGEVLDNISHAFENGSKCEIVTKRIVSYFINIAGSGSNDTEAHIYLRYLANKKYYGVIDYLQKRYKLSIFEMDLCSMICLGLSTDSIRVLFKCTNNRIIHNKCDKLRTIFELTNKESLEQFFKTAIDKLSKE